MRRGGPYLPYKERHVIGMPSIPGNSYDRHKLFETLEKVMTLTKCHPKEVSVNLGYRGVEVQSGTSSYRPKLNRSIIESLGHYTRQGSAIELAVTQAMQSQIHVIWTWWGFQPARC